MTFDKFYIILNPYADRGQASSVWPAVRRCFDAAGVHWQMEQTQSPHHATVLAEQAAHAGWPAVIVIGGDGTINEVVNGLMRASGGQSTLPIGVIPAGSGNDFVKLLGIPLNDVPTAVRTILHGRIRCVDVGRADSRYFINGVGWGFDGMVAMEAEHSTRLRGFLLYGWALLKALRQYHAAPVTLTIDGRDMSDDVVMVAMTNGACHGGGFWICPHAQLDDGHLDVCVAQNMPLLPLLTLILQVIRGAHTNHPRVWFETGQVVELRSSVPMPAHMDGEVVGPALTKIVVEVLPRRLRVLV